MEYLGKLRQDSRPTPHAGDRFAVGAAVVYLTGLTSCYEEMNCPEAGFRSDILPKEVHLAKLHAVAVLDAVERGDAPSVILPWIPLMQGGDDPGIIPRWLHLAGKEPDARRRNDLGLVTVFAEKAGCRPAWQAALEGWNVARSLVVEGWVSKGKAETLLRIVRKKFGPVPDEIVSAFQATVDLEKIDSWAETAALVATLDDFRRETGL